MPVGKRRFYIGTERAVELAAAEVLAMFQSLGKPLELVVEPFRKRISDPQRATLHSQIRDLARHCEVSEETMKDWLKIGAFPSVAWPQVQVVPAFAGAVPKAMPKRTMELTREEVARLLDQIGALGSAYGVEWSYTGNWSGE